MKKKFFLILCIVATVSAARAQPVNAALGKQIIVSSEDGNYRGSLAVDGIADTAHAWKTAAGKAGPHFMEIDLHKYHRLSSIIITGMPGTATTLQHLLSLQYWDDANWTDLAAPVTIDPDQNAVIFTLSQPVTTFSIRVQASGPSLALEEIEVYGELVEGQPLPNNSPSVNKNDTASRALSIRVTGDVVGKTMKYVGYNQGYYLPGSNVSAWLEYSAVNSLRVWTALSEFSPPAAFSQQAVIALEQFEQLKQAFRADPGNGAGVDWPALNTVYSRETSGNKMVFNYALDELKRLQIDVVLQINERNFEDNWSNKWLRWRQFYALAFHAALRGNVAMFAMQNEPNHRAAGPMTLENWMRGLQIASDAVRCAVEVVNKKLHHTLIPRFIAPVTAGNNTDWWAYVVSHIRDGYDGKKLDNDLFDIFSTHSYNQPAIGYATRVKDISAVIKANHPLKKTLPVVFTETGRWMNALLIDKDETYDSPSVFTEWAGMYANNMKNGGYGMWAFKFANTTSDVYPRGIKSGHHLTWQGTRIVEDAYENVALGRPVAVTGNAGTAVFITDGDKSDRSTWVSDSTTTPKSVTIDLGMPLSIGSAVVYTGSSAGVYTGSDRVSNFTLQYQAADSSWKDIAGTSEKKSKYVQLFYVFKNPVTTSRVRWVSPDSGRVKLREIKLFAAGDGPAINAPADYNVSGILRTGEVVRLFAKGFRDERPLLKTISSVTDKSADTYTCYDEITGNYYCWLVQRGNFTYRATIDLSALNITANAPVTIETVDSGHYGEITQLVKLSPNKIVSAEMPAQSVQLLTVPGNKRYKEKVITPVREGTVSGGDRANEVATPGVGLKVSLDASAPGKNQVAVIGYRTTQKLVIAASRMILEVHGKVSGSEPYRLHVYAIPSASGLPARLSWTNAPLLNAREALVDSVGQRAFVAGELAFDSIARYHRLDITDLVKKHPADNYVFVFIRETRQLGDDGDKGRTVLIDGSKTGFKPLLRYWLPQ